MNNFDLRKYLAEGRLKVNEGDMDHLMQDLERELKQHDWFYYMADDPRSYDKGTNEQRELKKLLKMLNNSPEAIALYNKYAPVQDGIDLRIKEERRPDYPDVDKDGNTEESMEKALKDKEVEGHKIDATDRLAEEDHDPDQEQLDDEDEIFMPMDDEGKPLGEAISQEVVNKVSRFITSMANYYDYSEQDAVYAIMQALKAHKGNFRGLNEGSYGSSDIDNIASTLGYDDIDSFFNDNPGAVDAIMQWAETVPDFGRMLQDAGMMEEDLDLGHEDDEPGMLKGDLYKIGKYSMELYQMMDDLEDIDGEVDLPHWWQSKVTTAKNMISGAKHYLEFELKEPAIDDMVTEDSLDDEAKVYFMQKVKRGEIDKLPEDPKAAFLAQMTKDQMDHDRETLSREGGLGEASFYTKDVKDKIVSKLMDQLKK